MRRRGLCAMTPLFHDSMTFRTAISYVFSFCLLFASVAGSVELAAVAVPHHNAHGVDVADAVTHVADCHEAAQAVQSASGDSSSKPSSPDSGTCAKTSHACCPAYASVLAGQVTACFSRNEASGPISFSPSLRLLSRNESIFRPPRLNS